MVRMEKVNEQIKREISDILLRELSDPRFELVSITQVDTSPDLRNSKVFFSVIGDEEKVKKALEGFTSAASKIRTLVAKRIKIRYIPEFLFFYDQSMQYSAKIEEALQEIHNENKKHNKND